MRKTPLNFPLPSRTAGPEQRRGRKRICLRYYTSEVSCQEKSEKRSDCVTARRAARNRSLPAWPPSTTYTLGSYFDSAPGSCPTTTAFPTAGPTNRH